MASTTEGLPNGGLSPIPASTKRFTDGSQFKIEIPSVESPDLLRAVIDEAKALNVPVHRVSQGSGIMLLLDEEIEEMLTTTRKSGIELCLFVGPRAEWDIGSQAFSSGGSALAPALRGSNSLNHAVQEIIHAANLGLRCILVADSGLLKVIQQLKSSGDLPSDLAVKTSAVLPSSNVATARLLEDLGATSINVSADLTIQDLAEIRQAVDATIDVYIESPDYLGGLLRYYDIPEIVRVASPVFLKFGLRNAPSLYPFGKHLRESGIASVREKVRRAAIGLAINERSPNTLSKTNRLKGGYSP